MLWGSYATRNICITLNTFSLKYFCLCVYSLPHSVTSTYIPLHYLITRTEPSAGYLNHLVLPTVNATANATAHATADATAHATAHATAYATSYATVDDTAIFLTIKHGLLDQNDIFRCQ